MGRLATLVSIVVAPWACHAAPPQAPSSPSTPHPTATTAARNSTAATPPPFDERDREDCSSRHTEIRQKQCNDGDAMACNHVGRRFHVGCGAKKDESSAILYYERACSKHYSPACGHAQFLRTYGEAARTQRKSQIDALCESCTAGEGASCKELIKTRSAICLYPMIEGESKSSSGSSRLSTTVTKDTEAGDGNDPSASVGAKSASNSERGQKRRRGSHGATGLRRADGRITEEAVMSVMRTSHPGFRRCYEEGLWATQSLRGRVSTRIVIDTDGRVVGSADSESTLPDPAVLACIGARIEELQFSKPDGGEVTLVYPFTLAPPGSTVPR